MLHHTLTDEIFNILKKYESGINSKHNSYINKLSNIYNETVLPNITIKPNNVYNMDCRNGMDLMAAESVDLILPDPPLALNENATRRTNNRITDKILKGDAEVPVDFDFTFDWIKRACRVLKETGSMYIISEWNQFDSATLNYPLSAKISTPQYFLKN